ncbi:hypothetical protein GCM10009075_40580 [Sphingomonas trueperi]
MGLGQERAVRERGSAGTLPSVVPAMADADAAGPGRGPSKCERQASWGELACRYAERGGSANMEARGS